MGIVSFELASVLISVLAVMKFKLSQKFTIWLLKGVQIILPPNDKDYQLICDLKKGKIKNPQGNIILRTCQVKEYINVKKNENYYETDLMIFFCLTSFVNLIFIEFYKFFWFLYKYMYMNSPSVKVEESMNENLDSEVISEDFNSMNVSVSFVLITISYITYILFKNTFRNGYRSYDAKIFYILFIPLYFVSFGCLYYLDNINVFNIDYQHICEIVNNRINSITKHAINQQETSIYSGNLHVCDNLVLYSFFSFVFSFTSSLLFNSTTRMAYFDFTFHSSTASLENTYPGTASNIVKDMKKIQNYSKFRQILNTFIFLLVIDPLFKNYLIIESQYISEISYYLLIILPLLIAEAILGLILLRYHSTILLNDNYHMMIDFCINPDKNFLMYLRMKMEFINTKFWEVFLQLFLMVFLNSTLFILFLNRSDYASFVDNYFSSEAKSNLSNFKFQTNFLETSVYFIILAIIFAKAVFPNAYTFYLKNFSKNKKGLVI